MKTDGEGYHAKSNPSLKSKNIADFMSLNTSVKVIFN